MRSSKLVKSITEKVMRLLSGENRIGKVSSVDAETGMVSVIYHDKDGEVTQMLPYATFNDEYKMPQIGAKVVVLHLSSGQEMGIVLGTYWNKNNPSGTTGMYHKDLGGGAYLNYDKETLTIVAEHIRLVAANDEEDFTVASLMSDLKKIKEKLGMDQEA